VTERAVTLSESPIPAVRIRLTALDPSALDAMPWLEAALSPEYQLEDLTTAISQHDGVLISDADGAPIGAAAVFRDRPGPGDATIAFLTVEPDRRFRGLGGEAGIALERHLRALGHLRVYAPVPEARGLAVYFWLRLGFRPLPAAESPKAPLGLTHDSKPGIWMLRDADSPREP
jgi:GNAT superfamily N-acetyltransferase